MRAFRPAVFALVMLVAITGAMLVVACQAQPSSSTGVAPATTSTALQATPAVTPVAAATSPAGAQAPPPSSTVPPMMLGASSSMTPGTAAAAPSSVACDLSPTFVAMRDLVGAATVGACQENERQIAGNGNVEQRLTGGTMMRRALDERLLFVGQSQTWIERDGTLFIRPADQRFEWEGDRQLVEAIRQGGYTIYFRHGPTAPDQKDTEPNNLANCATQRNLTDAGRQQARTIGEALRALNLPVDQVRSSEYCRAREYARLLFDREAEVEPALVLPDPLTDEQRSQNTEALKALLTQAPPSGTNRYLVSHSPNIKLAAGVDLPEEGGAAVFRLEAGNPQLVARIVPGDWQAWARAIAAH